MNKQTRELQSQRLFSELAKQYRTPRAVQRLLRSLAYNSVDTIMSAHASWKSKKAHCFEAALIAAAILEHHGYPPQVIFVDSKDHLGHVLFVFKERGKWGAIARSRDSGLHGRAPRYRSLDQLVRSYWIPYVDKTGWITGYSVSHLDDLPQSWRHYPKNMWVNEKFLTSRKQKKLTMPKNLYKKAYARYHLGLSPKKAPGWW